MHIVIVRRTMKAIKADGHYTQAYTHQRMRGISKNVRDKPYLYSKSTSPG